MCTEEKRDQMRQNAFIAAMKPVRAAAVSISVANADADFGQARSFRSQQVELLPSVIECSLRARRFLAGAKSLARSVGCEAVRLCFTRAQRSHRAARRNHRLRTHCAPDAGASAGRTQRTCPCLLAKPTTVRGLDVTLLPAGHIFGSAQFFLRNGRRLAALHRRFQIAPRQIGRTGGMAAGRHADHGNDLRFAALPASADRTSGRSRSSPFAATRSRKAPFRCCSATR